MNPTAALLKELEAIRNRCDRLINLYGTEEQPKISAKERQMEQIRQNLNGNYKKLNQKLKRA